MPRMNPTPAQEIARRSLNARHLADDAQHLADLLFAQADAGVRPARRLLARLGPWLARSGARVPRPTWKPIWDPARRKELATR